MLIGKNQSLENAILHAGNLDNIVDMNGQTRWITGEIIIPSGMKVCNGTVVFESGDSVLVLTGASPSLEHMKVDSRTANNFDRVQRGIVELRATTKAVIRDVEITGKNNRKAIFCNTTANGTEILDVKVNGGIGWGILFSDATSEQFPEYRKIGDEDYTGQQLGKGLLIDGFTYSNLPEEADPGTYYAGDAVEINCPDHSFEGITVRNVYIANTRKNGNSNGIGLVFARCFDVTVEQVEVNNTAHDGIHFEKGGTHRVSHFTTNGCNRALVTTHTTDSHFKHGTCLNSGKWLASYSDRDFGTMTGAWFEDILFDGCSENGFLVSNARQATFKNLTCRNYRGQGKTVLRFYDQAKGAVHGSLLEEIHFDKGESSVIPQYLIGMTDGCSGNVLRKITSTGYPPLPFQLDAGNIVEAK